MTSLDELRAHLTDDQRAILNKIWRHFIDHNEGNPWIPSGILYHQLGKGANEQTVHAILQPLGGTVVNEQADHNGSKHYILTALGFLLTEAGAEIEHVLSKYLEYMKGQYIDTDGTVGTIPLQEVATHFGFTEEQSFLLRRSLIVFYDLFGGGSLDAPSLPGCKDELIGKENLRAWLIEREFQKFNPKVPINRNPFLSYGTDETHDERAFHPIKKGEAVTENTADHDYDIMELLARLKDGIIEAVTKNTGWFEDGEYRNTRKLIMGYPGLRNLAPGWLHTATTLQSVIIEVRRLAGPESGKWDRAREIVADGLTPMIDALLANEIAANRNLERLDRLGRGGFGEVYRYRNNLIGVDFAVKILDPAFAGEGDRSFHRFLREARMLFQMNHPNIVRVHDIALTLGDRRPYIRMELVEGETLNERLNTTGSLAEKDANDIALQIAHALAHAHRIGVVHRDVKPSNIMLSPSGRVVLLDFGLGVFVEEDIVSRITKTDEAPAGGRFTAPELEANPKLLDPKTDVFSLGAMWFTMLCGQTPAGVGAEAVIRAVPSISNGVVELVLRCLALRAVERPTADDLIHELEKLRPAPALAVRHTEEEPEEVIEGEFATFWRDTV